jgi:hypothetical protein
LPFKWKYRAARFNALFFSVISLSSQLLFLCDYLGTYVRCTVGAVA